MDVTCDRCSTEYEFEEALVSPRGTTVKCTQCGHLFKVYRPVHPALPQPLDSLWRVRRTDGTSHLLPSLADLTRLISEATFTRDDEVSRTGKAWRRLGDIEELEGFFAEADRRGPSRARKATQGPILGLAVAKPIEPTEAVAAPTRADATPTVQLASAGRSGPAALRPSDANESVRSQSPRSGELSDSVRSQSPRPNSSSAAVSGDTAPTQPIPIRTLEARAVEPARALEPVIARPADEDEIATEQRVLPGRAPAAISGDPLALPKRRPSGEFARAMPLSPSAADGTATKTLPFPDLEDRDPEAPIKPRKSLWLWMFALFSTGLALSTWLLWPMPPLHGRPNPTVEDPSVQFLARADEAFATQRTEHFEQAITEYTKALAFHESDPHVLSSLARVYAVWAQETRYDIQAAERDPDKNKDVARRVAEAADQKQVEQLAEKAKWFAEAAARKNPGNGEAEVALADALRLTNNLVGARSELDHALATDKDPSAETLRVAALLAIDEAGDEPRAGLSLASQAVAKEPELLRTQILLARCLVGDGDLVGARYHLRAVTTRDRDHPSALAVEALMTRPADSSAPARDASVDDKDKDKDKPASDEPPAQYDNLSHEGYISRGQAMLEAGQVSTAKRMFEQALFIRPNSSQAHTGLGYVALEKGRPQLAAEHFLAATRAGSDEALIGLGDAYRRMSRPRDALRAYQNYLTHYPNGRQVTIARAQIERLSEDAPAKKAP